MRVFYEDGHFEDIEVIDDFVPPSIVEPTIEELQNQLSEIQEAINNKIS